MQLKRALLLSLVTVLAGCATLAPDYQRPAAPVPAAWSAIPAGEAASAASELPWREYFVDPQLRQLIQLALENSRDLRIAVLNVQRVQAQYRISRADLFPELDASAAGSARRVPADLTSSGSAEVQRQYSVGLGISSYELDLFGRVRSLKQQALEQYLASAEARRSVQLSLVAEVASSWLRLAADREQLRLARETLANQQQVYQIIAARQKAGVASELDLQQAKISVAAAQVDSARYQNLIARDVNLLQLLVGASLPSELQPGTLPPALNAMPEITPGLSSEVLLQRPDILAAEHRLQGADANIGAARAAFFPRVTLVSSLGTASDQLGGLFQEGSMAWNFAPGVTLPLFTAGANRANLDVARTDRDIAVARYEQAIQTAFREVADALARQATIDDQLAAQQALTDASTASYQLSSARYRQGVDSYLSVLDAQRSLYDAQQQLIDTQLAKLDNLVMLYKVLGGGSS
ncbi:MAG TPA: efflux transporter outer membrane subunit [Geothermobacteraceae bacterium]|nr:efflux transporter outer membrane subunit [Geothermobacteraceae bacterium]